MTTITYGTNEEQWQKDVVAEHLGGRFGRPATFGNGSKVPDQEICNSQNLPDIHSYFSAANLYGTILVIGASLAVLVMLLVYLDTLKHIFKSSVTAKSHTAFVVSVYPVVGVATLCAIVVPRAQLLAEAVAQGMFMFAMYQLFCLFVSYCGGEAELIRKVKPDALNPRVAPCCCWPCCCCLPLLSVKKRYIGVLRILVLQLPVVQLMLYMILLVMWAEEESLYQINYMYLQPVVVASILIGIWAMAMTIRMLREILEDYSLKSKFLVLQLVLLFLKLQGLGARVLVWTNVLPCHLPITPAVYGNLIYNSAMLLEMLLLGVWARHLYKKELPELYPPPNNNNNVQQVFSTFTISSSME